LVPFCPGCPIGTVARPMIMLIPQPISCRINMKKEIFRDYATPDRACTECLPHVALKVTARTRKRC
jgi:hypothetical protein